MRVETKIVAPWCLEGQLGLRELRDFATHFGTTCQHIPARLLSVFPSAVHMDRRGEPFYCRWCGKPWATGARLHRHFAQAQPCATLRWNHLTALAQKAHNAININLAIPNTALAPRQPPAIGSSRAKPNSASSAREQSPVMPVGGGETLDSNLPPDVSVSDMPGGDEMDWEAEAEGARGGKETVVGNEERDQLGANAPESVS